MSHQAIDVHQHLWPAELVDRLRARTRPRSCGAGPCTPTASLRTPWTRPRTTRNCVLLSTARKGSAPPA